MSDAILNIEFVELSLFLIMTGLLILLNQSRRHALKNARENLQALQEANSREQAAVAEAETAKHRLETVLSSINDGFYMLDCQWCFTYVNARYCDMVKMPPSKLLGQNIWQLFPAAIDTEAYVQFHRAMQEQTPLQFDYLYAPWNCWHDHRLYPSPNGLTVLLADISERRNTEIALQKSEEQLRLASVGGNFGLWYWDMETDTLSWTDRAKAMFGLPSDTQMSMQIFEQAIHPEDRPFVQKVVTELQANQPHTEIEYRTLWADGTVRWILARGDCDYNADGTVIATRGVLLDITERKQAEAAWRETNDRFEVAMQAINGIVFEWNLETGQVYRSEGLLQLVGVRAEDAEPTKEWWTDRIHPDDLALLGERTGSITPCTDRYQGEYRVRHEDGRWIDVWEQGYFKRNSQGDVIGVIGCTTNITDRKAAEAALQESESRFRTLANNIAQFAWMTNENGWIFWYNQRWFDYTGTTLEEMQGWGWQKVHHPDHVERVVAKFRHHIEAGEIWEDTFPLRGQDGQYRWFLSRAMPIRNEQGKVLLWFGTNTDITERKLAEAEREQLLQQEQILRSLAESAEAKLQQLLSSIREDFVLFDHNWQITYLNEQAADTLKMPQEEILGKNFWQLFPDLVGTEFYDRLHQAMSDRIPTQFEYYYPTWQRWYENRLYPTPDGVVNLCSDITQRKRTKLNEQFLNQLDAHLRQLSTAEAMVEAVVSSVGEYLNVELCLWHEVDLDRRLAIVDQTWRRGNIPDLTGSYDLDAFFTPKQLEVFTAGETLIIRDVTTDPNTAPYAQNYLDLNVSAFVSVPCIQSGRWVACLSIDTETVRNWHSDEVALLQEVVSRLWSLIERTRAVEELRQSEAEFRQLANAMPQIVWVADAEGNLEFVNERWIEYTGLTLEQSRDRTLMEQLIPPEDNQQLQAEFLQAQKTRSPYQSQFRMSRPNGSILHFLTRAIPILDEQGQICNWYGTSTDITGLKQLAEELRQKNAILNVINESSPAPIFVKDRQGRFIFANPATLQILGKSEARVIGYRTCELYPASEDVEKVIENDREIMESGQMQVVEESPDGDRIFLSMKVPYRNEAGEVIGLIGISNDITDRVQLERDRERILQQEQAAREAAENANRIKDEFLAVLSHELRSPLNPILGWSKLLQQGRLDATKTKMALATIERNAQLQSQLIEDLLDISRILRGKLSLHEMPVDLRSVILAALETVRLAAEAKSQHIQTLLSTDVGIVIGDAGRLQQVVWNLLSNAVKFTPHGGLVSIALSQTDTHAQIQVTDTGKGIKPEFLPYVFEHFRQEDGAITRKFGGLGLGLAIVRQIVEMHGGTVAVHSLGEGQGATFTVQIPLAPVTCELPTVEPALNVTNDLSGIQILVIDDEADSREFVAFVLEEAGAKITSVASGIEALQVIEKSLPDLIVSDIGMPEMDGYMLMQKIRSQVPKQQVPAIALTAYAGEIDRQQALQAGFQHHLAKPVEPAEIVTIVARLCGRKEGAE